MKGALAMFAALTVGAAAGQAQAGVSPPFILGTYYEQNGTAVCPAVSSSSGSTSGSTSGSAGIVTCQVLFSSPPAGKTIRLDGVSCSLRSSSFPLKNLYVAVNLNGNIQRRQHLEPTLESDASGFIYGVNETLHGYVVTSPARVVFDVLGNGSYLNMDCQIIGTLQPI